MPRQFLSVLVWMASAAGAVWLAHGDAGVADAPAQIVPQEFRVAAAETGRLAELPVVVGQRVRAGDLLARLDSSVLEREIALGEAHLKQLRSEPGASVAVMSSDGYASERSFQADVESAVGQWEAARAAQGQQASELAALREEIQRQRRLVREGLMRADRVEELEVRARSLAEAVAAWPGRLEAIAVRQRGRRRDWRSGGQSTRLRRRRWRGMRGCNRCGSGWLSRPRRCGCCGRGWPRRGLWRRRMGRSCPCWRGTGT